MKCFYTDCRKCKVRNSDYEPIDSYWKNGTIKVMLIGQDPTIRKKQNRVSNALMLDIKSGQISRWLKGIFGEKNLDNFEILGTNLLKCIFNKVPTDSGVGGINYLLEPFNNCKDYLKRELLEFKPEYVFTFGEPSLQLFYSFITDNDKPKSIKMGDYFTGNFHTVTYKGLKFKYSPLLHIQTYRIAKKYGDVVKKFENTVNRIKT